RCRRRPRWRREGRRRKQVRPAYRLPRLGGQGGGEPPAGQRGDADLSVERTRVAQPRADRGERTGRADRGDGYRRHARHHRAGRDGAPVRRARGAPRGRPPAPPRRGAARAPGRSGEEEDRERVRRVRRRRARRAAVPRSDPVMKVALLARSVFPLHAYGGLERHVYDLARALIERGLEVTLISPPPSGGSGLTPASIHPSIVAEFVPYYTFPLANRRGTTVLDRSTAYPLWGLRAGRRAFDLVRRGRADIVHGFGASVLGYARARRQGSGTAPLVMNPQGLEEFGATD